MQTGPQMVRTVPTYTAYKPQEASSDTSDEPPVVVPDPPHSSTDESDPARPTLPTYFLQRRPPRMGPRTSAFRRCFYPDVTDGQWHDWRWQLRHRVRERAELERLLCLDESEREALAGVDGLLPFAVTPYYMSLLATDWPQQPLRRTVIPHPAEWRLGPGEADDPLHEDGHSPVPGIVHRYPDRVLLLVHDFCATFCRYCTRSRVVGRGDLRPDRDRLQAAIGYVRDHTEVRDVLLSGGDPLTLADQKLDWILGELRRIPHVQILRLGTKVPAVLPQRITPALVRVLRRHQPLYLSLHFTHPDECTPEVVRACRRLADAGIPLGSQTVLLRGVNDDVATMRDLMHRLLTMRVRPYYLYQCDPIRGSAHFRTSIAHGLEIIRGLRGWTSGYAVPTYVIDAPGGGGKIPLQPDGMLSRDGDDVLLRSYNGGVYRYPDPDQPGSHESVEVSR